MGSSLVRGRPVRSARRSINGPRARAQREARERRSGSARRAAAAANGTSNVG